MYSIKQMMPTIMLFDRNIFIHNWIVHLHLRLFRRLKTLHIIFSEMYICTAYAASIQRPAGCPDSVFPLNLATFDQLCLQFNFEKIDWEVARNRCLSDGGDLIQIRNESLQTFLQQVLTSQNMEKTGFWIGASDRDLESQWEWVTGKYWVFKLKIRVINLLKL